MSHGAIDGYSNMNPYGSRGEERISFSAVVESGGRRSETSCTIPLNQLPESVRNEIEKIKKDV
jgi:ABC-2 type transport system permease protein